MRRRTFGRKRTEDILEGRADPKDPVGQVVAAAKAPPDADEIAGVDAAVAAFTSAAAASAAAAGTPLTAPTVHRGAALRTLVAGTTARKIIAVAAGAAAAGAIAVAVTVGGGSGPAPSPTVSPSHTSSAPSTASPTTSSSTASSSPSTPTSTAPASSATGSPSGHASGTAADRTRRALCRTWLSASVSVRARDPRFRVLINAAGGVSQVNGYCTALLNGVPKQSSVPTSIKPTAPRAPVSTPRVGVSTPRVRLTKPAG